MKNPILILTLASLLLLQANAQQYPTPAEGDFAVKNFQFADGSSLGELKLHYTTVGQPRKMLKAK